MDFSSWHENKITKSFDDIAAQYHKACPLREEILSRMLERLPLIKIAPEIILDLQALTTTAAPALSTYYSNAHIISQDLSQKMLKQGRCYDAHHLVCASGYNIPLENNTVDLVFSCLGLHWYEDMPRLIKEIGRVLKPTGLFFFTLYGPDTLKEFRDAWQGVNDYSHVQAFFDMHDIGDLLLDSQFQEPVMDMEFITLKYKQINSLIRDLRAQTPTNYLNDSRRGFTPKGEWSLMQKNYEKLRDEKGYLPATCEIIYGHAWGMDTTKKQQRDEEGNIIVPMQKILRSKKD